MPEDQNHTVDTTKAWAAVDELRARTQKLVNAVSRLRTDAS